MRTKIVLAICCLLFLISCPNNIIVQQQIPDGMGIVTISFANKTARTIIPLSTPDVNYFESFNIDISPRDGGASLFNQTISRLVLESGSAYSVLTPLPVDTYIVKVEAYRADIVDIAAEGQTEFSIGSGEIKDVPITLRMSMLHGTGDFEWDITFSSGIIVTTATMTFTSLDDPVKIILNPEIDIVSDETGTVVLDSGLYNVEIIARAIDSDDVVTNTFVWSEVLHIYSTLKSEWNPVFTPAHFATHPIINFNYGSETPDGNIIARQSVLHGGKLTELPSGQRPGRTIEGWYTDTILTTKWNLDTAITGNMTLYARWVDITGATIGLEVEPIPFAPTFEVSLTNDPFEPVSPATPIALSRTGFPNPNVLYFRITNTATTYDANSIEWKIGTITVSTETTFILDVSTPTAFTLGGHSLRLSVKKNETQYMINIPFTVEAGESFQIGDLGPGGGIIFYVADGKDGRPDGFTVQGHGSPGDDDYFAPYRAHYLEAAPSNISGTQLWAGGNGLDDEIPSLSISGSDETDRAIGRGRMNTAIIIARGANHTTPYATPAASACAALRTGDKDDWFLPSRNELHEIWLSRDESDILPDYFWSSSQSGERAWIQDDLGYLSPVAKDISYNVRAIRAF